MRQFYLLNLTQAEIDENSGLKNTDKNPTLHIGKDTGNFVDIPVGTVDALCTVTNYRPATTFNVNISIPEPTVAGVYSLIIIRKGAKFNERNKWTASVYVKNVDSNTRENICKELVKAINNNSNNSGVVAEHGDITEIEITAIAPGVDYEIKGADELMGLEIPKETITAGTPAINDVAYIKDLADKAAADRGYEYTYQEANELMYPNRSLNELKQLDPENKGFTVYTLKFADKRMVKTTDTAIKQIVQIAVPTGITLSTVITNGTFTEYFDVITM